LESCQAMGIVGMDPVLDGGWGMPQDVSHFIAIAASCHEKNTVQAVIIPGVIRATDLLLELQNSHSSVLYCEFLHRVPIISIGGSALIYLNYYDVMQAPCLVYRPGIVSFRRTERVLQRLSETPESGWVGEGKVCGRVTALWGERSQPVQVRAVLALI